MSHIYTVELRFYGDSDAMSDISARMNLAPSRDPSGWPVRRGERQHRLTWSYNGGEQPGFRSEWSELSAGLEFMFEALRSRKDAIAALTLAYSGLWWCGHFQKSFDGGPTLSPGLLTEIGSYGAAFFLDNYFES